MSLLNLTLELAISEYNESMIIINVRENRRAIQNGQSRETLTSGAQGTRQTKQKTQNRKLKR
jgi:hypothetical protein